jgi:glycosyltransferase involved in cell wall biosynthesis
MTNNADNRPIKLIIQIPCYNEEKTIGITLSALPRLLTGIDSVEWLVIDDGSIDRTIEVARTHGVDHIVRLPRNQGLARAFMVGIEASLQAGADIIVNTDADNQYCAEDIPKLIEPILAGMAEIVVGTRPIGDIKHFSPTKKILQKIGSAVVRIASNTDIHDAPSGFRAISREAAMRLNVFNGYTYTLETIIQAGQKNMAIYAVPVRVNENLRPSRLVKSIVSYVINSIITILRIFVVYKPFKFFMSIGLLSFFLGILVATRFMYYFLIDGVTGHVQSLILSSILIGIGFQTMLVAFLADLLAVNRRLIEDIQYRIKVINLNKTK